MAADQQSFSTHIRFDPPFHFFILPVGFFTLVLTAIHFVRFPSLGSGWLLVVTIAALTATFRIRIYPLRLQDRIIRLEERLRLATLLPEAMRSRIPELTDGQLIGLRFASDEELPALTQRALDEKLSKNDIKKAIVSWRPDHSRI